MKGRLGATTATHTRANMVRTILVPMEDIKMEYYIHTLQGGTVDGTVCTIPCSHKK